MSRHKGTRLPSLTSLESIKEALDVRLGRRGDPLDRAVTVRDVMDAGFPVRLRQGGGAMIDMEYEGSSERIVPPTPEGLIAQSHFGGINLIWDNPIRPWQVSLAEIYRSSTPNVSDRMYLTSTGSFTFFDVLDPEDSALYYYWVRFASVTGHYGAFSGPVSAMAIPLVSDVMERLTEQINESHLAQQLGRRIDKIEGLETGLAQEISERRSETEALAQQLNTAQASLGDDLAAVQTSLTANVQRINGELVALGAGYTAQVQANGLIGGFGVYNDGAIVDAAFDVDRFWVGRTNSEKRRPFIIQNGVTYIDTAMIRDASIQEGQLGPITVGKLRRPDGTPVTTVAGLIRADAIDVASLNVASAATFTGAAQSTNFPNGGWRLHPNGTFNLRSSSSGARLDIQGDRISVFDAAGRLRVRIGRL